jgi:hypothetical protein
MGDKIYLVKYDGIKAQFWQYDNGIGKLIQSGDKVIIKPSGPVLVVMIESDERLNVLIINNDNSIKKLAGALNGIKAAEIDSFYPLADGANMILVYTGPNELKCFVWGNINNGIIENNVCAGDAVKELIVNRLKPAAAYSKKNPDNIYTLYYWDLRNNKPKAIARKENGLFNPNWIENISIEYLNDHGTKDIFTINDE